MDTATEGTTLPADIAAEAERHDLLTLGIEEEYLLVDAAEPRAVEAVDDVFAELPEEIRGGVQHEYYRSQIEVASPPRLDLADLRAEMTRLRSGVAAAAERAGARLVAVGTGPAAGPNLRIVDKPRYHRMRDRFGDLSPGQGMCGTHVHVSIPDPETGVKVLNHLRPWLPVLQAAAANSPLFAGRDTGYASWRSMMWERWPTVGPTPYLRSHEHYLTLISDLEASGAMLDEGMLYWYARLSANYPTVEIRLGDVTPTLDDAMLLTALARGLVATLLREVRDGIEAPDVEHPLLMAAHWRAAHDGLEGLNIDMATREPRPAWRLMRQLFDYVRPELERHGDLETTTVLMGRLRAGGTGGARQRAMLARGASVADVVDELARLTKATEPDR
ncbi:putative glutamate--cysteine ligase [Actinoplanes missouriensis 431]|uniref:Putative glutamate--cysteine ligase 2 n=1 Tax=Actinoplanes missouriensis (strain ATCC 14538 / DSM 43046 / CBS 188.64 / JCM 3121 / NBRC 102363 / NCIMB 12654 / NRRL B-3342 / UNCC 431) TaxID=512565 RepID=I0HHI9_ACTM4|nr:glutamate--cysteine ligase [Actinoplanes missouriensis]BAL92476.1 putative glutamate--cysteine ligase [Actinoplanes missouriensis 431]